MAIDNFLFLIGKDMNCPEKIKDIKDWVIISNCIIFHFTAFPILSKSDRI